MKTTLKNNIINGVDVDLIAQTIEAIKGNREIAKFQFRAKNRLIDGELNESTIKGFYGACTEHRTSEAAFVLNNDEPPILFGSDSAPNPVEYLIQSLLGCITTTTMYRAAGMGIEVDSINSEVEGDLDLHGMMVLDPNVRPGFQEIRVKLHIKSKGPKDKLRDLHKTSPVFDTLSRPVPIHVDVLFDD